MNRFCGSWGQIYFEISLTSYIHTSASSSINLWPLILSLFKICSKHLQKVPSCDPTSNNLDKLYHYRMYVLPTVNFSSKTPTTIEHNKAKYRFDGYSIFSHQKLESVSIAERVKISFLPLIFLTYL